jgi:leucyl-tRNA---protein transferase
MFAQVAYPEILLPEELDKYLAAGWFRMRQTIFTTNFLYFDERFYAAIWLRVKLDDSIYDKRYRTLSKQNKGFRTEIKKTGIGAITPQHELLYLYYRQSISFDVSPSLQELLYGNETVNRFNTYEVNIYDGDTLIAAGFFDLGKNSAAGISSIYHPAYKKYSLGKYLVYQKMDFCKQQQIQYFYPGYVVPGYASFDYKLEIGKSSLQYLSLSTQQWQPYLPAIPIQNPLQEMIEQLFAMMSYLSAIEIPVTIFYYRFFEAALHPYYYSDDLFDFPVFLYCQPTAATDFLHLIVYDVQTGEFLLMQCSSVIRIVDQREEHPIFESDLLKVDRILCSTKILSEMGIHLSCLAENKI